ncbi:hypothetical protein AHAS_Ahas16G0070800 [Arachis hypogaea]
MGKKFKHGSPRVKQNVEKALESFEKAATRGFALARLMYWGEGRSREPSICS